MPINFLVGKKVLITAGPTREALDPVRFISNHSSGKMGYAIAEIFLEKGAEVILVSGPVQVNLTHSRLSIIHVQSANEMFLACCQHFEQAEIIVFAAAVADYRPMMVSSQKIKKSGDHINIKLVKNVDIAYEFGRIKKRNQLSIGFALETNDELLHALDKLKRKNFDIIILNSMNDAEATFGYDTNKVSIISEAHGKKDYALKQKKELARDIVQEVENFSAYQFSIGDAVIQ
jgi:phosphopantothenoylcysteine decarboxylase / phosphopantothenate---cysteine ligase